MGLTCVTKTTTHTSKNSENGRTATVRPPPPWLYLAITWPKIIPQKMLSNRNNRHERARHLATRRGVARRIYHSMASLLHCWRFFTSWTDSREVGVVEEVGTLNNHHHRCRRRIRGIRWGGEVVGWICTLVLTYHPTRYHQKIIEFVFWGGSLMQQSKWRAFHCQWDFFFLNIKIYSIFPPAYGLGGKCQRTTSCYLINNQP